MNLLPCCKSGQFPRLKRRNISRPSVSNSCPDLSKYIGMSLSIVDLKHFLTDAIVDERPIPIKTRYHSASRIFELYFATILVYP